MGFFLAQGLPVSGPERGKVSVPRQGILPEVGWCGLQALGTTKELLFLVLSHGNYKNGANFHGSRPSSDTMAVPASTSPSKTGSLGAADTLL